MENAQGSADLSRNSAFYRKEGPQSGIEDAVVVLHTCTFSDGVAWKNGVSLKDPRFFFVIVGKKDPVPVRIGDWLRFQSSGDARVLEVSRFGNAENSSIFIRIDRTLDPERDGNPHDIIILRDSSEVQETPKSTTDGCFMSPDDFSEFSYSKKRHFDFFREHGFDLELIGRTPDAKNSDLKIYQDLLAFSFISLHIAGNSRILEVGGGQSRILKYFRNDFECWNIDKLEGIGDGPTHIDMPGVHLVRDYIGSYSPELLNDYFDFVFSISALEHVAQGGSQLFEEIYDDINRVLRPGGYSLHIFDSILYSQKWFHWMHPLLLHLLEKKNTLNGHISCQVIADDIDLFVVSETTYNQRWAHFTKQTYEEFGKPFSCAVLWRRQG